MSTATTAPPIRWHDTLRAEITKILTYPVTWLAAATTLILNTTLGVLDATDVVRIATGGGIVRLSELGNVLLAPVYAFVIIAVFAAGTEYQGGQLRVALTTAPARQRLFTAKAASLLTVIVPAAVITIAPGRLIGMQFQADPPGIGSIVGDLVLWTAAYIGFSVVAFGLTILLRNVVAPLALMTLIPLLAWTGVFQLPEVIRLLPHDAALSLLSMPTSAATELEPSVAGLVLLAWCLLATVVGSIALTRRDS